MSATTYWTQPMTWSFDASLSTSKDFVRALLADTSESVNDGALTDESIEKLIEQTGSNVMLAASMAALIISAHYAKQVNFSVDGLKVDASNKAEAWRKTSEQLRAQSFGSPGSVGTPLAGGISIAEMASVDEDPDRPPSRVTTSLNDPPGSIVAAPWLGGVS